MAINLQKNLYQLWVNSYGDSNDQSKSDLIIHAPSIQASMIYLEDRILTDHKEVADSIEFDGDGESVTALWSDPCPVCEGREHLEDCVTHELTYNLTPQVDPYDCDCQEHDHYDNESETYHDDYHYQGSYPTLSKAIAASAYYHGFYQPVSVGHSGEFLPYSSEMLGELEVAIHNR